MPSLHDYTLAEAEALWNGLPEHQRTALGYALEAHRAALQEVPVEDDKPPMFMDSSSGMEVSMLIAEWAFAVMNEDHNRAFNMASAATSVMLGVFLNAQDHRHKMHLMEIGD